MKAGICSRRPLSVQVLDQGPAEPRLLPGGHRAACGAGRRGRRGDGDYKAVAED